MSDSVSASDALHPAPASTPVLARLPRVGMATLPPKTPELTPEQTDVAADASDGELPILVLLDDEPTLPPGPQEAAIDALSEAATPAWQDDSSLSTNHPIDDDQPSGLGTDMDAAGATPIFRIHRWLAPYSSVIVTVAVIAAAGLLFMVASQPTVERIDYDAAWAESASASRAPRTPETTAIGKRGDSTSTTDELPPDPERTTIVVAQRPAAAAPAETTPRELPEMTLGPPRAYPSTGSQPFDPALLGDRGATETQSAPQAGDTETGRYERY